jgi:hypothetical protein
VGEVRQQASAAASTSALDRADRHIKDSRGILDRVALHVDEHQGGTLLEGQVGECSSDIEPKLLLRRMVWTCRHYAAGRIFGLLVRQRHRWPDLAAPDAVQASVDHNPMQPRGHRCVTAEGTCAPECGDERILYRIRRLLRITEGAQSDRPQPVTVTADEFAEGVRVAVHMSGEQ